MLFYNVFPKHCSQIILKDPHTQLTQTSNVGQPLIHIFIYIKKQALSLQLNGEPLTIRFLSLITMSAFVDYMLEHEVLMNHDSV